MLIISSLSLSLSSSGLMYKEEEEAKKLCRKKDEINKPHFTPIRRRSICFSFTFFCMIFDPLRHSWDQSTAQTVKGVRHILSDLFPLFPFHFQPVAPRKKTNASENAQPASRASQNSKTQARYMVHTVSSLSLSLSFSFSFSLTH